MVFIDFDHDISSYLEPILYIWSRFSVSFLYRVLDCFWCKRTISNIEMCRCVRHASNGWMTSHNGWTSYFDTRYRIELYFQCRWSKVDPSFNQMLCAFYWRVIHLTWEEEAVESMVWYRTTPLPQKQSANLVQISRITNFPNVIYICTRVPGRVWTYIYYMFAIVQC